MDLALLPPAATTDPDFLRLWLATTNSPNTRRAYELEIRRISAAVPKPLRLVSLGDLIEYRESLTTKANTQNRTMTAIKSLLSFGHKTGYLPFNVGAALKLRPDKNTLAERILEESEVARLIDRTEGRNHVILKLFYASGIRVSELCALKWKDAVPRAEAGQITVFGKGGKTRAVLLKPKTWKLLDAMREGPDDPVFRSQKKGHLDPSQVRRIIGKAAREAGLSQKVSPHWLRHAHASHALERGARINLVQVTLGHASVATTGKYLHARPTESSGLYLPD